MELQNYVFIIVFIAAFAFLFYSLKKKIGYLKIGKKADNRFDNIGARVKNVLNIALGQSKILRDPIAGPTHTMIFWGFLIFLFAVLEAIIQGFYSGFSWDFLGPVYGIITVVQDLFIVLVFFAVLFALFRRYIQKIPRLETGRHGKIDATIVLALIFTVVVSMLFENAVHIAENGFVLANWELRPVSLAVSKMFYGLSASSLKTYFEVFWWIHIITVFGFMNFLPYSKHFHVYSSIPNVFFNKIGSDKYALKPLDLEDEEVEQFGAVDVDDLSWKDLLDGYACTECGRCYAACPAANTGKALSPRKIIVDIRHRLEEKAPLLLGEGSTDNPLMENTLVHNYITDAELWACTTCNACVYECPVTIEHVDKIVDMRRNLVLMESEFPPELNTVFKNLETNFSPWAFNWQDRADWAEGMNIKTMAEDSNGEILFWVGCAGSFDARYIKATQATAQLMQKAGVDFRILGTEEKCNGDSARRLGNEYLAQTLMQENIETLNKYNVKKIVTGCPHCFNSLKNEFPQFNGNYEVVHHTEFLKQLIDEGKIELKDSQVKKRVTYHDSCYLGRYNDIFDEPRVPLSNIGGIEMLEMDRNRDKGFCCGAGGGRMFLEETEGTRINENRVAEALETGADTIASACPFCMTMLTDGVKTKEKENDVSVKDIAEIILENTN